MIQYDICGVLEWRYFIMAPKKGEPGKFVSKPGELNIISVPKGGSKKSGKKGK